MDDESEREREYRKERMKRGEMVLKKKKSKFLKAGPTKQTLLYRQWNHKFMFLYRPATSVNIIFFEFFYKIKRNIRKY